MQRAVITGIGVVSPIGIGLNKFWQALLNQESGIGQVSLFDASSYPSRIAAEVKDFDARKYLSPREAKVYSRATQFACTGFELAKQDANLDHFDPDRTDVLIGTSINAFEVLEEQILKNVDGIKKYNSGNSDPISMLKTAITSPACAIALKCQAEGYVSTISSACASGIDSIGQAMRRIQNDEADIVICGSVDAPINRLIFAGFCNANFLSTQNDLPTSAIKPFDQDHNKHVLGEGAGIFILENMTLAKARKAKIYGEISNFALGTENMNQLFMLDKKGKRWAKIMAKASADHKVDHVNSHAPSDKNIDLAEGAAIENTLLSRVNQVPVTSIKGAIGQGMSSAGALQVAAAIMTLKTGVIPPILNHKEPQLGSRLYFVKQKIKKKVKKILINSHGIGGINAALVLAKVKK